MASNDEFGYHELLHTASIMVDMWSDHIQDHAILDCPKESCEQPELMEEAEKIGNAIAGFYQLVALASDKKFKREDS